MKILLLGGDLRNEYLFNELSALGYDVEKYALNDGDTRKPNIHDFKIIIGPVPFTKDNTHLYTPLSTCSILIPDFLQSVSTTSILMAGSIPGNINIDFRYIDLTKNDWLYNETITATTEGIVQILLDNIHYTINGSTVLVTGYGKVGKSTSEILRKLNAKVSIYSTNEAEQKEIGYNNLAESIDDISVYDIIVNTIPCVIFQENNLETMRKGTLLVDIASFPGGIDRNYAETCNIAYIAVPGIPGKKAPLSVAKAMKKIVEEYIL